jgi:O-antigen ligase
VLATALVLLAAFMLASIGGRYAWPLLPGLVAAALLFLLSGARVGADPATRPIDAVVIAALALIGFQLAPLPPVIIDAVSPGTPKLQDAFALVPFGTWRPLSIHPAGTRTGLMVALTAALLFWAAREAFSRGGSRAAARLLGWIGFTCALVSLAQRATAPRTVLWNWTVPDPRAVPFGPFVDRNQLATWLVLAISLVAGYLAMHVRAHTTDRLRRGSHAVLVALSDGGALAMVGCLTAMLIALAATLSRSGFIALVAAAAVGASLGRRDRARGVWVGVGAAAALLALAAWLNLEGLVQRFTSTLAAPDPDAVSRLTIWRDTSQIVRAFPWLGTGQGTFADAMFVYQETARQVLFNHAHDEYLQVLTEGGLVMLLLVVMGLVLLARTALVRLAADEGSHRFVRIGACAALVGVAVQSVWETGLRAPANLLLAALLAALAVVDRRDPSSETTPA